MHARFACVANLTHSEARAVCSVPHSQFANGAMMADPETITYKCNDGYRLIGAERLNCLPNNTWSAPTPRCVGL